MDALRIGTVGILPAGALGVSFFYHLTARLGHLDGRVVFLERKGSQSGRALREAGHLLISDGGQLHRVPTSGIMQGDLLSSYERGELPEIVILCPNPDQLLGLISACVELLERIYDRGELRPESLPFPKIVLSSNGIYYQRIRQILIEKLEEATLLGRLPDLWPELMPLLVGRLLRGVTIQTGLREGVEGQAIYHPGEPGITRLAGGDAPSRERCCELLKGRGGWFELAAHSSATRLEFDKAMINLIANLLGQIYAIDEGGRFKALTVAEILVPGHEAEIRELAHHIFKVGQAVRAYGAEEDFEALYSHVKATALMHGGHVPSSLQWLGLKLRLGQLRAQMSPTESWLIEPLIRYARAADLEGAAGYFEHLRERLLGQLAMAAR